MNRGLIIAAVLAGAAIIGWRNRYVFAPAGSVTVGGIEQDGSIMIGIEEFLENSAFVLEDGAAQVGSFLGVAFMTGDGVNQKMRISFAGVELVKRYEGFRGQVYDANPAATKNGEAPDWTVGYGHKLRAGESFPKGVTKAEGQAILLADLQMAENRVFKSITRKLSQSQFDALTSLAFNLTSSGWRMAAARINKGETAQSVLSRYVYGGGVRLAGLVVRRNEEIALYYRDSRSVA